ncbi:hypothetical protein KIW84_013679 [Lathyrus oleraceus]|uniref:Uncharacterized protein n=1 Tax=Pisum sativum TaxID=3888 RepID=A0A9D5BL54_PEA|nr:hypothetical protein KIW84_013679 [Pisum sativum]
MKPKYGSFVSFPDDVFSFPTDFEELGLSDLIGYNTNIYPEDGEEEGETNICDPEMMLLYAIKNNFRVDWGHTILSHMMSHDEYAEGLPHAHFLTKIFRHFNINMENELCFSMEKPSFMISIKQVNWKMGVIYNHQTHKVKYLDNDDEEPQPEVHSDEEFNPPLEAQPDQPSNQMIMEYLQGILNGCYDRDWSFIF